MRPEGSAEEDAAGVGAEARQDRMKSWRRGFIRCRAREEPCGCHQVAASSLKWEISSALTEEVVVLGLVLVLLVDELCHRRTGAVAIGASADAHCDDDGTRYRHCAARVVFRACRTSPGVRCRNGDDGNIMGALETELRLL